MSVAVDSVRSIAGSAARGSLPWPIKKIVTILSMDFMSLVCYYVV